MAPLVLFGASAQEAAITPLPADFNPATLISGSLLAQAPVPQPPDGVPAEAQLDATIINRKTCAEAGYHLTYRLIVRNRGAVPANDVVVQNQYPAGTTFVTANRQPDQHLPLQRLLIWNEGFLGPGEFISYTFTVSVDAAAGAFVDNLTVNYTDAGAGGNKQTLTSHTIQAGCQAVPNIRTRPLTESERLKEPAIICDPAEVGCVQILPKLGVNFQRAQAPGNQPQICSRHDERGCVPNKPQLGARFTEAIADIIPGDCRVLEDDIISTPEFQDALNRRSEPSAVYLQPLLEAGNDFRRLVLENSLLGIQHLARAKTRLQSLSEQADIAAALQDLERDYNDVQKQRREKFDPVAEEAIQKAIDSIQRACGGDQGNNIGVIRLREALPAVKAAHEETLNQRSQAYRNMIQLYFQQRGRPFDELFEQTFAAHREEDERADDRTRLERWETALDAPKEAATACEAENVFAADVETTWCESNNYAQIIVEGAPAPAKAKQGLIAPPDLTNLIQQAPNAIILDNEVRGAACGGGPGDPWWAADCSCQCGQVIPGAGGQIRTCQDPEGVNKQINRHDIFVTSQEECLADGTKHQDQFF